MVAEIIRKVQFPMGLLSPLLLLSIGLKEDQEQEQEQEQEADLDLRFFSEKNSRFSELSTWPLGAVG